MHSTLNQLSQPVISSFWEEAFFREPGAIKSALDWTQVSFLLCGVTHAKSCNYSSYAATLATQHTLWIPTVFNTKSHHQICMWGCFLITWTTMQQINSKSHCMKIIRPPSFIMNGMIRQERGHLLCCSWIGWTNNSRIMLECTGVTRVASYLTAHNILMILFVGIVGIILWGKS